MFEVRRAPEFTQWLSELVDRIARKRISDRIARLEAGLFGDAKAVGDKIFELRVDHGPGYRVYLARRGVVVVLSYVVAPRDRSGGTSSGPGRLPRG